MLAVPYGPFYNVVFISQLFSSFRFLRLYFSLGYFCLPENDQAAYLTILSSRLELLQQNFQKCFSEPCMQATSFILSTKTTHLTVSEGKKAVDVRPDQSAVPAFYVKPSTAAIMEGSAIHTESICDSTATLNLKQISKHTNLSTYFNCDFVSHQPNTRTVDDLVNFHSLCSLLITRSCVLSVTNPHIRDVCKFGDSTVAYFTKNIPFGVVLPMRASRSAPRVNVTVFALRNTLQSGLSLCFLFCTVRSCHFLCQITKGTKSPLCYIQPQFSP